MKSNIEYVMKFSQLYVTPGNDTSNKCEAFSFVTIMKTITGMRADIDYYGTTDTDITMQHLFNALNHLPESPVFQAVIDSKKNGKFRIFVSLPTEIDRKAIEGIMLNKLDFENELSSSHSNCILVQRST